MRDHGARDGLMADALLEWVILCQASNTEDTIPEELMEIELNSIRNDATDAKEFFCRTFFCIECLSFQKVLSMLS